MASKDRYVLDKDARDRLEDTLHWKERQPIARKVPEIAKPKKSERPPSGLFRLYSQLEYGKPASGVRLLWNNADKVYYDSYSEDIIFMGNSGTSIAPIGAEVFCEYVPGVGYMTAGPVGEWGYNNWIVDNDDGTQRLEKLIPYGCYALAPSNSNDRNLFGLLKMSRADLLFQQVEYRGLVTGSQLADNTNRYQRHGFLRNIAEDQQYGSNGKKVRGKEVIGEFYERPNELGRQYRKVYELVQPPCWVAYDLITEFQDNIDRVPPSGPPRIFELFSTPDVGRDGYRGGAAFDRNEIVVTMFWWRWVPDSYEGPVATPPGPTPTATGTGTGTTTTTPTHPEPPDPIWYLAPNEWWLSGQPLTSFSLGVAESDLENYYPLAGFVPYLDISSASAGTFFGDMIAEQFSPLAFKFNPYRTVGGYDFERTRLIIGAAGRGLLESGLSWGVGSGYGSLVNGRVNDFNINYPPEAFQNIVKTITDTKGGETGGQFLWSGHYERVAIMGYISWHRGYRVQQVDTENKRIYITGVHGTYATYEKYNFDPALVRDGVPQERFTNDTGTPSGTATNTPTPSGTPSGSESFGATTT